MKDKRRTELEIELKKLKEINESAMKYKGECKDIATKSDISSSLRLEEMESCLDGQNEMEKKVNYDIDKINKSNTKLIIKYDDNAFNSNFNAVLKVEFDHDKFELKYDPETEMKNKVNDDINIDSDLMCLDFLFAFIFFFLILICYNF